MERQIDRELGTKAAAGTRHEDVAGVHFDEHPRKGEAEAKATEEVRAAVGEKVDPRIGFEDVNRLHRGEGRSEAVWSVPVLSGRARHTYQAATAILAAAGMAVQGSWRARASSGSTRSSAVTSLARPSRASADDDTNAAPSRSAHAAARSAPPRDPLLPPRRSAPAAPPGPRRCHCGQPGPRGG